MKGTVIMNLQGDPHLPGVGALMCVDDACGLQLLAISDMELPDLPGLAWCSHLPAFARAPPIPPPGAPLPCLTSHQSKGGITGQSSSKTPLHLKIQWKWGFECVGANWNVGPQRMGTPFPPHPWAQDPGQGSAGGRPFARVHSRRSEVMLSLFLLLAGEAVVSKGPFVQQL